MCEQLSQFAEMWISFLLFYYLLNTVNHRSCGLTQPRFNLFLHNWLIEKQKALSYFSQPRTVFSLIISVSASDCWPVMAKEGVTQVIHVSFKLTSSHHYVCTRVPCSTRLVIQMDRPNKVNAQTAESTNLNGSSTSGSSNVVGKYHAHGPVTLCSTVLHLLAHGTFHSSKSCLTSANIKELYIHTLYPLLPYRPECSCNAMLLEDAHVPLTTLNWYNFV